MAGEVKIANAALRRIHAEQITDMAEKSPVADLVRSEFDDAVEHVLRRSQSGAAQITECLKEMQVCKTCILPPGFCHAFALPAGALRIVEVWSQADACACSGCAGGSEIEWRRQAVWRDGLTRRDALQAIISPCSGPLLVEYIHRPDNLDDLPGDVRDLIALRLALKINPKINADKAMSEMLMAEYDRMERDMRWTDAKEDRTEYGWASGPFVDARRGAW